MSANSKIEWCDATWNPVLGCSKVSPGCAHCYAERMTYRQRFMGTARDRAAAQQATTKHGAWSGEIALKPWALDLPLRWRKPKRIFVQSMGDLFHPGVPCEYITKVFDVMCSWRWPNKRAEREGDTEALVDPGHTFMVLTKRPERIKPWLDWVDQSWPGDSPLNMARMVDGKLPKHIQIGTSVENQATADERIPHLLRIPAVVRFVSCEPLLGYIDLTCIRDPDRFPGCMYTDCISGRQVHEDDRHISTACSRVSWVIVGGENGPGARPMNPNWARSIREQCVAAGVPFFFKSFGQHDEHGKRVGKRAAGRLLDGRTWDEVAHE